MLRAYLAIGLVIAVIGLTVMTSGDDTPWIGGGESSSQSSSCDLLGPEPCSWTTREGEWRASLRAGEAGEQGVQYHFSLQAPVAPERFLAVLRGQSMYMGEYPVPLVEKSEGRYAATFTAPFCATGTEMIWRVELRSGERTLDINGELMTFNAVK
jgi:hypothetical protein